MAPLPVPHQQVDVTANSSYQTNPLGAVNVDDSARAKFRSAAEQNLLHAQEIVLNTVISRAEMVRRLTDPRRDIDRECGYPTTAEMTAERYQDLYNRDPIARKVVRFWPNECWVVTPSVYEKEDSSSPTDFERAFGRIDRDLRGNRSWFRGDRGGPFWSVCKRADIVSGIGTCGIIIIGIDDGRRLEEAAEFVNDPMRGPMGRPARPGVIPPPYLREDSSASDFVGPPSRNGEATGPASPGRENTPSADDPIPGVTRRLRYLRPLPESMFKVEEYDEDELSDRYMQPLTYQVLFYDPRTSSSSGVTGGDRFVTKRVHWTRVVHLADNIETSEQYGTPRLQPVLNAVLDIKKVRGTSAEGYYQGAIPGIALETLPQLAGNVGFDEEKTRKDLNNFLHGFQRFLMVVDATAKQLAPTVVSPRDHIDINIEAICIEMDVPQRIFMGSERGEQASTQDQSAWNKRVMGRHNDHLTPNNVVPLLDRLILLGCLPVPGEGYFVYWPDLNATTDLQKAEIASKTMDAIQKYLNCGAQAMVTPFDFWTRLLGRSSEEAKAILDAVADSLDDGDGASGTSSLLSLAGGVEAMLKMFDRFKAGAISEQTLTELIMLFYKVDEKHAKEIVADTAKAMEEANRQAMELEAKKADAQGGGQGNLAQKEEARQGSRPPPGSEEKTEEQDRQDRKKEITVE